jgi:hypothetical protein
MISVDKKDDCVNCGRNDGEIPILRLSYQGEDLWICSSCFPILIHKPEQLAGRLESAENIPPSSHSHD